MRNYDLILGIDPDVDRSGVATLHTDSRRIEATTMTFPDLLDYLRAIQRESEVKGQTLMVVVEGGWLNSSNWHISWRDSREEAAAKGNGVGRNHETGRKIVEMCAHWQIPHKVIKPLPLKVGGYQLWSGKGGKISAAEIEMVTGLKGRTNQESRDAALIAWHSAGFPIAKGKAKNQPKS